MANFPGVDPKMYEEVSSYLQEQEQRNPEAFKQLGGFNGFVRTMVGAARALERDPEGAIRYLDGIDLARLGPNPDELSQTEWLLSVSAVPAAVGATTAAGSTAGAGAAV
jgi:hypothetical protein